MASQYAPKFVPECLPIIDPRKVPLFYIGGLRRYEVLGGWAVSQYYGFGPISSVEGARLPPALNVCLQLVCLQPVQLQMRSQIQEATIACEPWN